MSSRVPSRGSLPAESLEAYVIVTAQSVDRMAAEKFTIQIPNAVLTDLAHRLYTIYRYENAGTRMNMIFRDHTLSDLIGFVYSGMQPQEAANNLVQKIKESAQP